MKNEPFLSSNLLLDNIEGANLLLEYFASFSKRIFAANDFKTILKSLYEELRKLYVNQRIEVVFWQNSQHLVKFSYNETTGQVTPDETLGEPNTLYHYVLAKRQPVLTNNYQTFCENSGINPGDIPASSWLGVPMQVRDKVLGALVVWDNNPEHYLRVQDKQFLATMANMAGFAVENLYLVDYIVEKNGAFLEGKLRREGSGDGNSPMPVGNLFSGGQTRNSVKSGISRLLQSALQQPAARYTALYLGTRQRDKWRLVEESFREREFSTLGNALLPGLAKAAPELFKDGEEMFWRRGDEAHPLTALFAQSIRKYPADSALFIPFAVNEIYLGAWIVVLSGNAESPGREELQFYRFIFYLITQLIEKRALLERNRKYESYLRHLERMKNMGELASSTVHSLNNLLSVVIGKGQVLQKKLQDTPYQRDLKLMLQAALDGANTIRRMQDYSAGKSLAEPETLDLNLLIQEVVDIARPRIEAEALSRNIHYDVDVTLGDIKPVNGDAAALREVILNLITNAAEAMPRGGKLAIQTTLKDETVIIFISDTGVGIPPEICDKIFEPFYTTKGKQGNGLGLSIAADIVKKHNGKIYVDSIPYKGSIFMIELPTAGDALLPKPSHPQFLQPLSLRVLLVENKGIVLETLAEMLEDEGCRVITAANAHEALLKFQRFRCDVVFADLGMPGINGVELARRLKKLNNAVPVFIVTGWNKLDDSLLQANGVIDGIIKKPFTMERVRHEMLRVVAKYRHFKKNGVKA